MEFLTTLLQLSDFEIFGSFVGLRRLLMLATMQSAIFNLFIITIIIRYLYYPVTKNKDYLFTYFLISLTVFILCILDNVKLELGFLTWTICNFWNY